MTFRRDNTEGFSDEKLEIMNAEVAELMKGIAIYELDYNMHRDNAEHVIFNKHC